MRQTRNHPCWGVTGVAENWWFRRHPYASIIWVRFVGRCGITHPLSLLT